MVSQEQFRTSLINVTQSWTCKVENEEIGHFHSPSLGAQVHRRQLSTRRHLEQVKRELSSWSPQGSTGCGTSQLSITFDNFRGFRGFRGLRGIRGFLSGCIWRYLQMLLFYLMLSYVWMIQNLQDEWSKIKTYVDMFIVPAGILMEFSGRIVPYACVWNNQF